MSNTADLINSKEAREILDRRTSVIDIGIFLLGWVVLDYIEPFLESYASVPESLEGIFGIMGAFMVVFVIMKLRGQTFADIGLRRPIQYSTFPLWILAIFTTVAIVGGGFQIIAEQFFEKTVDASRFSSHESNILLLIRGLVVIWITAAFFEEIVYRGFLMGRMLNILGSGMYAGIIAAVGHAILFGALHSYQGLVGVITTGLVAIVFGMFFVLMKRNLWALIIVHGLIDTIALVAVYNGGLS